MYLHPPGVECSAKGIWPYNPQVVTFKIPVWYKNWKYIFCFNNLIFSLQFVRLVTFQNSMSVWLRGVGLKVKNYWCRSCRSRRHKQTHFRTTYMIHNVLSPWLPKLKRFSLRDTCVDLQFNDPQSFHITWSKFSQLIVWHLPVQRVKLSISHLTHNPHLKDPPRVEYNGNSCCDKYHYH